MNKNIKYIMEEFEKTKLTEDQINKNIEKIQQVQDKALEYSQRISEDLKTYKHLNLKNITPEIMEVLFFDFNFSDSFIANLFDVEKKDISNYRNRNNLYLKTIFTKRVFNYKEMDYDKFLKDLLSLTK